MIHASDGTVVIDVTISDHVGSLAATGSEPLPLLIGGVMIVVLGVTTMLLSARNERRQQRRPASRD